MSTDIFNGIRHEENTVRNRCRVVANAFIDGSETSAQKQLGLFLNYQCHT
jgi:hypothetical protein